MEMKGERFERIRSYGLSDYEARTYLALLELGAGTAREVSNLSRVPQSKVYDVLSSLRGKALVVEIPERPKRFRALPFAQFLERYEREYREKLERIEEDRALAKEKLAPSGSYSPQEPGEFYLVTNRKAITEKAGELLAAARKEVCYAGSGPAAKRLRYHMPTLKELEEEDVKIRLLLPETSSNASAVEELRGVSTLKARTEPGSPASLLVVDGETSILWHASPDDSHVFQGEDIAFWTDDPAMTAYLREGFQARWTNQAPSGVNGRNGNKP